MVQRKDRVRSAHSTLCCSGLGHGSDVCCLRLTWFDFHPQAANDRLGMDAVWRLYGLDPCLEDEVLALDESIGSTEL